MSLMLKLLATTLLLSSFLEASSSNKDIESFLKKQFSNNKNIVSMEVRVEQKIPIKELEGWYGYILSSDAIVKAKPKNRKVTQKMVWFSNGTVITKELVDIKSGISLKEYVTPPFKDEFYKKENLIYGNEDAEHKVAIFSDPLCPFCRNFVPKAINDMRKQPNKFAIYYYHLPLAQLHPAAVDLSKAAVAAELQGKKDVVLNLYKVKVDAREKDTKKILAAFNKTMKTDIKPEDLKAKAVLKHIVSDLDIAEAIMVNGTPTVFFDGKLDKTKRKYEKVK